MASCYCRDNSKDEVYKNIPKYSLPVRMGHWFDENALEESKLSLIAMKGKRCELLCTKSRVMLANLLALVNLSPCIETIEYESVYQICAANVPQNVNETYPYQNMGIYLSGTINEREIEDTVHLNHGCIVTGSSVEKPCRRNTWIFQAVKSSNRTIAYGDDLYIRVNQYAHQPPLYLQAESSTIDNFGPALTCRLSRVPDLYCHFRILHAHPKHRAKCLDEVIQPRTDVIIQHVASGRNLAAETTCWLSTFFGVEISITCHTHRDSNRIETAENLWRIIGHFENSLIDIQKNWDPDFD